MRTTNEFVIEWVSGDKTATVTAPENSALANRLAKLSQEFPDSVQMKHSELFHVDVDLVHIRKPMTAEAKARLASSLNKPKKDN